MDEAALIQDLLDRMFEKTRKNPKATRVRVVNLSVYDKGVDPDELTRAFRTLTSNTIAQGANLHVRRCENIFKAATADSPASCPASSIRLDSLELEETLPFASD